MTAKFDEAASELEQRNSELSLEVAREGIVLLENNGVLPLQCKKIALYGAGARHTAKCGTGSGEVNNRHSVSVEEGLEACGLQVTTKMWLDACDEQMHRGEEERDAKIKQIAKKYNVFQFWDLMNAIALPIVYPTGRDITERDVADSDTDTALYVLTRQAGEGMDRRVKKGEYNCDDKEIRDLKFISEHYKNTILVLNPGACIDVNPLLEMKLGAVIFMGQAGQNGGLALAHLLLGKHNFCGKLAATWAKNLQDLPCSDSFSYLDGNTDRELYKDGIYVGYRYFDTFDIKPKYAFGYGLSYTEFEIKAKAELSGGEVTVKAQVENIGKTAGKEVVQIYLSCPSGKIKREYQQLAAFAKTDLIAVGECGTVTAGFELKDFAAYDETRSCFILEKGNYIVRVGNSSRNTTPVATIVVDREFIVEKCKRIEFAQCRVEEIAAPVRYVEEEPVGDILHLDENAIQFVQNNYDTPKVNILPETKKMNVKELTCLCVGDPTLMSGGIPGVVGASGQIDTKVCKKYGYHPAVMADGPAGIRISMKYAVEPNGKIKTGGKLPQELVKAKKLFRFLDRIWSKTSKKAKFVYQFCTAWPSATVQAQTFSPALVRQIGIATSCEMQQYKVGIWLAPGMNIQRYPLCGRNYEYYSEDPILTAEMASALTLGVQSDERCAVTIKHFCCNNQEDNRMKSSSEVNERALREIYLKAFKLTVRKAKPKCVMSSYNKVNGTYVNSSYDLITNILRCEFGFDGVVMTDWQSVAKDQAVAGETICAENDLIMAGDKFQHKELLKAVKSGKVAKTSVQKCASRILNLCKNLNS